MSKSIEDYVRKIIENAMLGKGNLKIITNTKKTSGLKVFKCFWEDGVKPTIIIESSIVKALIILDGTLSDPSEIKTIVVCDINELQGMIIDIEDDDNLEVYSENMGVIFKS